MGKVVTHDKNITLKSNIYVKHSAVLFTEPPYTKYLGSEINTFQMNNSASQIHCKSIKKSHAEQTLMVMLYKTI